MAAAGGCTFDWPLDPELAWLKATPLETLASGAKLASRCVNGSIRRTSGDPSRHSHWMTVRALNCSCGFGVPECVGVVDCS
jgi:hypothetical protein